MKLRYGFSPAAASIFLLLPWSACLSQDEARIGNEEYQRLLQEVDTHTDKTWRQIPWKTSLLDAQNEAAKSRRPIFIWAMDGHPLGCT